MPDSAAAIRRRRVLNRTGYRPAESRRLVSWIEPELAARVAREAAAALRALFDADYQR